MKNFSAYPSDENAVKMFQNDSLGRNDHIFRFIKLLDAIDDCCAIALNGEWGNGKTFFVKQTKLLLDYDNPHSNIGAQIKQELESSIPNDFHCKEPHVTVYYDAWANDNDEDPILSLIHAIISSNQATYQPDREIKIVDCAAAIAGILLNRNISNFLEKAKGTDPLQPIKKGKNINQLVNELVNILIQERGNRLVIFIDELDRCKPIYAVQLLERIKHYFNDDRITFVFSVNLFQLQHTIKCYYGEDFDATRYLDKFFDLHSSLPEINYDTYLRERFNAFYDSSNWYDTACVDTIKYFHLSLRETERFIRLIKIAYNSQVARGMDFPDGKALTFSICFIVPVMIGLRMTDISKYRNFINGVDFGPLCEILGFLEESILLGRNECFSVDQKKNDADIVISTEERLQEIYFALFTMNSNNDRKRIGQMEFSLKTRAEIKRVASLLSPFAEYDFE